MRKPLGELFSLVKWCRPSVFHPHPSRLRRATFPREGEGFWYGYRYYCAVRQTANLRAFPLMGEGGAAAGGDG